MPAFHTHDASCLERRGGEIIRAGPPCVCRVRQPKFAEVHLAVAPSRPRKHLFGAASQAPRSADGVWQLPLYCLKSSSMPVTIGRAESISEKGPIGSPAYGVINCRPGTEPGTLEAAQKPMMPIMARRPLLISATRPLAFFSGEAFFDSWNGSKRSKGTGCGTPAVFSEGGAHQSWQARTTTRQAPRARQSRPGSAASPTSAKHPTGRTRPPPTRSGRRSHPPRSAPTGSGHRPTAPRTPRRQPWRRGRA
eukprot:scaffold19192_cov67-Phaeocystis_antarctica.AAC.8